MDKYYCDLHDKVVAQGGDWFEYDYRRMNGKYYHYEVDLLKGTQTNTNTRSVRLIRRLIPCAPY